MTGPRIRGLRQACCWGLGVVVAVRALAAFVSQPGTDDLARDLARRLSAAAPVAAGDATEQAPVGEEAEAWLFAVQAGMGASVLAWVASQRRRQEGPGASSR